jgi:cell division septal protein FtsQ
MRRLERHPESRNILKGVIILVVVLLVVGVGVCTYLAFFTSTCRITRVEITGNVNLPADYIRKLSGIDSYKNLLTLPTGKIVKNLEQDAWIHSATVSRQLLHTVKIKVTESTPKVMLDCKGTGYLVDGYGKVIVGASLEDFKNLPRVYAGNMGKPKVGSVAGNPKVLECIKVISAMPDSVRNILLLANPFDGRGYVFNTRPGFQVVYGPATAQKEKNSVLQAIVADVSNNSRNAAYVDVRVPDEPVIKLN